MCLELLGILRIYPLVGNELFDLTKGDVNDNEMDIGRAVENGYVNTFDKYLVKSPK